MCIAECLYRVYCITWVVLSTFYAHFRVFNCYFNTFEESYNSSCFKNFVILNKIYNLYEKTITVGISNCDRLQLCDLYDEESPGDNPLNSTFGPSI